MPDVSARIDEHERRITSLEDGQKELRTSMAALETHIAAIDVKLENTATKAHLEAAKFEIITTLRNSIDRIVGAALTTVPKGQSTLWTVITGLIAFGGLVVAIIEARGH